MSSSEMQACLARLYVDASFRRLFHLEALSTLAAYDLTDAERGAVLAINRPMLELFAGSLRLKRRYALEGVYGTLFRLQLPLMDRYFERYCQLYLPKTEWAEDADAGHFGCFIEDTLRESPDAPRCAADLARYERLRHAARQAARRIATARPPQILSSSRPRVADGVQADRFGYDVIQIREDLLSGRTPDLAREDSCYLMLKASEDISELTLYRLNVSFGAMIELCDGQSTAHEITCWFERTYGEGCAEEAHLALEQLSQLGLLEVPSP